MTNLTIGIIGVAALVFLIFIGMHIGTALMLVGFVGYAVITNWKAAFAVLSTVPAGQAGSYSMIVVPLFILMGCMAYYANLSKGLYDFGKKWLSRVPGGLACGTIAACAVFGAICGSTAATCATMGTLALPEMRRSGYSDECTAGSIAFGGTLGVLIPPSTPMILYGVLTTTSIGALFSAGIVPGIVTAFCGIVAVVIMCKTKAGYAPIPKGTTWKEKLLAFKDIIGVVILFGVCLGGMFAGYFSVSQASAIGAFVATIMTIPAKNFTRKNLYAAFEDCISTFSMTFLIMMGAAVFSAFLAISTLPTVLATSIQSFNVSKYLILLAITVIYVFLGMIMDALPMMMLTVPIFFPIIKSLGFDAIWYGIYMVLIMNFGSISPPVGLCLFIVNGIDKDINLGVIYKGVLPFIIAMFVAIILITIFPGIVSFLPHAMGLA